MLSVGERRGCLGLTVQREGGRPSRDGGEGYHRSHCGRAFPVRGTPPRRRCCCLLTSRFRDSLCLLGKDRCHDSSNKAYRPLTDRHSVRLCHEANLTLRTDGSDFLCACASQRQRMHRERCKEGDRRGRRWSPRNNCFGNPRRRSSRRHMLGLSRSIPLGPDLRRRGGRGVIREWSPAWKIL